MRKGESRMTTGKRDENQEQDGQEGETRGER